MADGVAGKIRVDVQAGTTKFAADMKGAARDGVGGFRREYEQHARQMGGISGWQGGKGGGSTLLNMLPWGPSTRAAMNREAAEMARHITENTRLVSNSLRDAQGKIAGTLDQIGAPLGLSGLTRLLGGTGTALLAGAAAIGTKVTMDTVQRAGVISEARKAAMATGIGIPDTSRLQFAGFDTTSQIRLSAALSRPTQAQRLALFELGQGGMIGQPMTAASVESLIDAFNQVGDSGRRNAIAMQLFGRRASELAPVFAELKEKMKGMPRPVTPAEAQQQRAAEHARAAASGRGRTAGLDGGSCSRRPGDDHA